VIRHHQRVEGHDTTVELHPTADGTFTAAPERLSFFQRIADKVSYAMGTPANILIWIVLVATWIALGPELARINIMPAWFTSNSFNFPLNTVTTIAELYIGFLVGASSNRSERNLEATLTRLEQLERRTAGLITENTDLTKAVQQQALVIASQTAALQEMSAGLSAVRAAVCTDSASGG
jgi:low affinity Fe/Cu permease